MNNECRLLDRYELQQDLVEALEHTEHHRHLAEKVLNCHKKFRHKHCDGNHDWAKADNSCSVRICPHCAHRRAKELVARAQAFLAGKSGLRYLVLAERNSSNLAAGIASLFAAWTRLRRSVRWKHKVSGCLLALEVTYNRKTRTWHPHLNVLTEGEYFPFAELNQAWIKATCGNGRTSRINQVDEGTVNELLKYVLKVAEREEDASKESKFHLILEDPAAIDEFLASIYGARVVRTYGTFHGLGVEDEASPEKAEKCPDCGSTRIFDLGKVSHEQLSFDFEKQVFRVLRVQMDISRAWLKTVSFDGTELTRRAELASARSWIAVEARQRVRAYEQKLCQHYAVAA